MLVDLIGELQFAVTSVLLVLLPSMAGEPDKNQKAREKLEQILEIENLNLELKIKH